MKKLTLFFFFQWTLTIYCMGQYAIKKSIIQGKIDHYDPSTTLSIAIDRLGKNGIMFSPMIDKDGYFHMELEIQGPTNINLIYKTYIQTFISPTDSLLGIHFDGSTHDLKKVLSSIQFYGASAETNQHIAQYLLLADSLRNRSFNDIHARKNYDPKNFLIYNDSVRRSDNEIYQYFVKKFSPNGTAIRWAKLQSQDNYLNNFRFYTRDYRDQNNLSMFDTTFVLPRAFYDCLTDWLPFESQDLNNPTIINLYATTYKLLINQRLKSIRNDSDTWRVDSFGILGGGAVIDSVIVSSILTYATDPILKELMLTQYFSEKFHMQDLYQYEQNTTLINEHIISSFLKKILQEEYLKTKNSINHPLLRPEVLIIDSKSLSGQEVFDGILNTNKGKVIYIDLWATWCGPCIGTFPHSSELEKSLRGKNISFVYLCLGTDHKKFESYISQYNLQGQHYYLNDQQNKELLNLFEIQGIPYYILIDDKGNIIEKGNHISPYNVKAKIESLIVGKQRY